MFVILACATCILLIVILMATSSRKPAQLRLDAGSAIGARRPILKSESAGTLRPCIRQGLETKAVAKTTSTDSRLQAAKAANSKSLTDRNIQSMIFPATHLLTEAAEKTGDTATANLEIAAHVEIAAAPNSASSPVNAVSASATEGSAPKLCAGPAQEAG